MKTPDEIKLGLECCVNGYKCGKCCPYNQGKITKCTSKLSRDALAYIRELEAARDRYWAFIKGMGCESCSGDCDRCDGQSGWTWSGEVTHDERVD